MTEEQEKRFQGTQFTWLGVARTFLKLLDEVKSLNCSEQEKQRTRKLLLQDLVNCMTYLEEEIRAADAQTVQDEIENFKQLMNFVQSHERSGVKEFEAARDLGLEIADRIFTINRGSSEKILTDYVFSVPRGYVQALIPTETQTKHSTENVKKTTHAEVNNSNPLQKVERYKALLRKEVPRMIGSHPNLKHALVSVASEKVQYRRPETTKVSINWLRYWCSKLFGGSYAKEVDGLRELAKMPAQRSTTSPEPVVSKGPARPLPPPLSGGEPLWMLLFQALPPSANPSPPAVSASGFAEQSLVDKGSGDENEDSDSDSQCSINGLLDQAERTVEENKELAAVIQAAPLSMRR